MSSGESASSYYRPEQVARYFDKLGIGEWNRLTRTAVDEVSLFIHSHYLEQYVVPGARVLEIGAGAGRFTERLAALGAHILVADLSQEQLRLNRQHARDKQFADAVEDWLQMDVCAMDPLASRSFDIVVAYGGPLSYVFERRDEALRECVRVLRPGGLLLLSVMSLWGSVHRHLEGVLAVPADSNREIIATGDLSPKSLPGREHYMHLFRSTEVGEWLERHDLHLLALSASNCLALGWEELLEEVKQDEEKWRELLQMELEACAEPGSLDMGTHLIAVAQVPANETAQLGAK